MNTLVRPVERRRDSRRPVDLSAVVAKWPSSPEVLGEIAQVEDMGPFGFRLRSGLELRPDDVIRIIPQGAPIPLYARVVWSRRDGVIEKGPHHRVGAAHAVGCVTLDGPPRARQEDPTPFREFLGSVLRGLGWAAFFAVVLGVMVSAGYLLVTLVTLLS